MPLKIRDVHIPNSPILNFWANDLTGSIKETLNTRMFKLKTSEFKTDSSSSHSCSFNTSPFLMKPRGKKCP